MDLDTLNTEQKKAVLQTDGRVLILAGAGSGKTRVLTTRMAYLITNKGVPPSQILGLTFTNKAAQEMKKRMATLVSVKEASSVWLSTFHSFCLKVLREEIHHLGFTKNFTLYDQNDVERLIKIIARDILQIEGELPSLAPTLDQIAKAKSKGLKPDDLPESSWHEQFTKTVYARLKDAFRAYNALDFDSLLTETVELFERFPDVLSKYHEKIRYVMIDEYQDTNPVQSKLTDLLTRKWGNLCVVGDDDQSIYGWRGASVRNILDFQNSYVIKLEQNFRSTSNILAAANHVIRHNTERHDKQLWSKKNSGQKIEIFHAPTDIEESQAIAARIMKMQSELKVGWSHFAILYRSNSLSRLLEMALLKLAIPYKIYGGLEFYERKEVKDLLAYMRVAINPLDQEALLRIINYPRRGIGENSLDILTKYNRQNKLPLFDVISEVVENGLLNSELSSSSLKGLKGFVQTIQEFKERLKNSPSESMKWLLQEIDYKKAIREEVKSEQMRIFKQENVEELISALSEYEGEPKDFIADNLLDNKHFKHNEDSSNKVTLMTFHSSKGLEFPYCFLAGLEDHIIPHERSIKEGMLEEERRLMYVAITRAQEKLTFSMARTRKKMGDDLQTTPSRFLFDIPKDLLDAVKWDSI